MRLLRCAVWLFVTVGAMCGMAWAAEFTPVLEDQLAKVADKEFVSAIIILESPVDIQALDAKLHAEKASKAGRYAEVMAALKYNAETTQPAFRQELEAAKLEGELIGFTPYWIDNLFVVQATKRFLESLRVRGDVKYVTENFEAELIEPVAVGPVEPRPRNNPLDSETLTPGQNAIFTTRVNRELGITGQGVLVANLDTGVDGNHNAFRTRWRGFNNAHPWQECWRDALGGGTTFPSDGHGHGTHVMGTITGRAISGSDTVTVGGAPNAQWIADNAINQGVGGGFDNDIIDAYQWFANPDGNVNTLDDVPDVVQNSWGVNTSLGYVQCFAFWNTVILNCEAVGVVVTWSAGNEGTSGLRSPAIYSINATQIFSVGAVDATNYGAPYPLASFSSRGPTPCTPASPDNIKPEIAAPGVDVYSSWPGGGYSNLSGTSMAGPHVAGVVALMREACPNCDPQTIKEAIMLTATDYGAAGQDNLYGAGLINAYEAVLHVMAGMGRVIGTVRDAATLQPLEALVEVVGGPQTTTASATGNYALILPGDSTYTLRYSFYGCETLELQVTTVADDTVFQDVNMQPRPVLVAFNEDFENGAAGWTHESGGGTWVDQWHLSSEQSQSPTHAYKCGDTGTGTYANFNDARLISPVVANLPEEARLRFRYQIESEISRTYGDSAYDGGVVELSVNSGPFTLIHPVGGYPKTFRYLAGGSNPAQGPMPGWPCFADTLPGWHDAAFDLTAHVGQSVQFRFRFGSDNGVNREGWYIDDVVVSGFGQADLEVPQAVTIYCEDQDVLLSWTPDGSPAYRVYSDITMNGNYDTLVAETTQTSVRLTNALATGPCVFYVVRGYQP